MIATVLRITANGLEHSIRQWLPPERQKGTVVLIHGYMDAGGTWDRVAPALAAAGHRVLAPDMRGFGAGARAPAGSYYHFVDYVFDVADLVEALVPGGESVGVVGHSMGGTISTLYAGTFPERVSRLALLEGLGPPDNPFELGPIRMRSWIEQVRAARARSRAAPTFSRAEGLARLAGNHPNVPPEVLEHRLPHLAAEGDDGRLSWHFDPLHKTTSPMPFFVKLFIEFARKVTCPVLFVSGGPRGFHPSDEGERLAAFAELRCDELPQAGHMMHWTEPEKLAPKLVAFLA
ncbi:MAG: alpha/beta hydrolase [Labilithrix sp.]|nr:alpha/beta hydrolase [Labilithrix sp.]